MNQVPEKEEILYKIWEEKKLNNIIRTVNGDNVTIIDIGERDGDFGGPDYKNARIKIGNFLYIGDIEIDVNYNNWKLHGHNINKKYNKTVLHLCLFNKFNHSYVYSQNGRKIPSVKLDDFIDKSILEEFRKDFNANTISNSKMRCSSLINGVDKQIIEGMLKQMGIERFKKKCDRVYHRLKELKYLKDVNLNEPVINYSLNPEFINKNFSGKDFDDIEIWQQLFYEMVFEALGYSKNKDIMLSLAQALPLNFIKKNTNEINIEMLECLLFNIAGLVPKETEVKSSYLARLEINWEHFKKEYDGRTFNEEDWHFFKLRPQNFPTLRLAGGARLIFSILKENLLLRIVKKINEINNEKVLMNSLRSIFIVKSDGYWCKHFVFEKETKERTKYFVGLSRANEIVINVILPYFSVYFDIYGNKYAAKKLLGIYNIIDQQNDNKIVSEVAESLQIKDLSNSSLYTQGMIDLFRHFCSKERCLECGIGEQIFS